MNKQSNTEAAPVQAGHTLERADNAKLNLCEWMSQNPTPKSGGPAFPSVLGFIPSEEPIRLDSKGMSLRAWFAGLAMEGMLACAESALGKADTAKHAAQYADALIAELAKEGAQ